MPIHNLYENCKRSSVRYSGTTCGQHVLGFALTPSTAKQIILDEYSSGRMSVWLMQAFINALGLNEA